MTTQALARVEPEPEPTGLALVVERLAANPSVDVVKLERIIALQERILAHQAKAAFDAAFAALQGDLPVVVERGKTDKAKYATLEDIIETARPILARHHFSLSHRTEWPGNGLVKIVGILAHEQGHEKTSEFLTAADTSGSKNAVQALGSAMSYGRRYTTLDLLGIVTRWQDDDGIGSAQKVAVPDPPVGYEDWCDAMTAVADNGWVELEASWKASPEPHTIYTNKHRAALKAAWKTKAQRVDAKAKGGARA